MLQKFKDLFAKVSTYEDEDILELVISSIGIMAGYVSVTVKARARLEAVPVMMDRDDKREFAQETARIAESCMRYFDAAVSCCDIINRQCVLVGLEPFCPADANKVHDFCLEVVNAFGVAALNPTTVADLLQV